MASSSASSSSGPSPPPPICQRLPDPSRDDRVPKFPLPPLPPIEAQGQAQQSPPAGPRGADGHYPFLNFDDEAVYKKVVEGAFSAPARNFVVEFGDHEAQVAYDLTEIEVKNQLLDNDSRLPSAPVRWINIWNPSSQRGIVEAIGDHYNFSRRLTMSIWAWDQVKSRTIEAKQAARHKQLHDLKQHPHTHHVRNAGASFRHRVGSRSQPVPSPKSAADLEHGIAMNAIWGSPEASGIDNDKLAVPLASGHLDGAPGAAGPDPGVGADAAADASADDIIDALVQSNKAVFQIMQESLNYTTIDQEQHFVCIGANWLHRRAERPDQKKRATSLVPPKHWSWFVLCEDHTVISFHEAAYYEKAPKTADKLTLEKEELANMRSNTLKVFRQLSKLGLDEDQHKFSQLTSVRDPKRRGPRRGEDRAQSVDSASNLFYYLFEDYSAAFDVLNTSRAALDEISGQILRTAVSSIIYFDWKNRDDTTDIIPRLYTLNKEMRQLQHLFSNYKTLIDRLLSSAMTVSERNSGTFYYRDEGDNNSGFGSDAGANVRANIDANADSRLLSAKAVNRFRRLQVQLQSLMLDAIQDCIDEKESLQDTYFHLITQKDSHSTERLTRSATLLAKLSVFFLPISFMTSYFSIEIPGLIDGYTAWTYWGAFAVIASISFLSLFFFSKVLMFLSERLDHWADGATRWTSERVGLRKRRDRRAMEAEDEL